MFYFRFSYLIASMGLQVLWSFGLACLDMYALRRKRDLQNPILVSLFVVGDWVFILSPEFVNVSYFFNQKHKRPHWPDFTQIITCLFNSVFDCSWMSLIILVPLFNLTQFKFAFDNVWLLFFMRPAKWNLTWNTLVGFLFFNASFLFGEA